MGAAFIVIGLLVLVLAWGNERARNERGEFALLLASQAVSAADERARLQDQYADERRELLTRIQHPQLLVTKAEPSTQVTAPEEDEWDNVGKVLDLVEVDEDQKPDGD